MNYGQQSRNHVTMIDDLPELSDIETRGGGGMAMRQPPRFANNAYAGENLPPEVVDKYRRHIRQTSFMRPESGMAPYGPSPQSIESYEDAQVQQNLHVDNPALTGISCLDIANHVKDCPICSRFYNNDKTVYIIVIVVLAIICLLLLKKVLDV